MCNNAWINLCCSKGSAEVYLHWKQILSRKKSEKLQIHPSVHLSTLQFFCTFFLFIYFFIVSTAPLALFVSFKTTLHMNLYML